MSRFSLALKNLFGSAFRSVVVIISALLVAAFALSTTLIMRGAQNSIQLANDRLGADIVVVPEGAETKVESALLMGKPATVWMPSSNLQKVASLAGIAAVSPQLYLSTLANAACCSASNMFMIAYDPKTDFTLTPWLKSHIGDSLKLGEAVGGTLVFTPSGQQNILLYGYFVTLKANLEATGTGLDQSMFFTFDTAKDIARVSISRAAKPLEIPDDKISAIMVKVQPGADINEISALIVRNTPGVTAITSPNLFLSYRQQMLGLLRTVAFVLVITWFLSIALIGLVFSMASNERRRELGVLRSLGATRDFVMQELLTEAAVLAMIGGGIGVLLATAVTFLFRSFIFQSMGVPFVFPSLPTLAGQIIGGLLLAVISVGLAALLPAYRISRQDPAIAMRE
jgi:putative ABC transport system permease protein